MVSLILLTHGDLCSSFFKAATTMLGDQPDVYCIPTLHLSSNEITKKIKNIFENSDILKYGAVIAVDLKGGSTWNVACKLTRDHDRIAIISGINLPMLLSFLTKRESLNFKELTASLVDAGKRGIEIFNCSVEGS
ncbi:PTS sugar transporter subunit IIA [candidate division KSB1 bacterium]|nr:PTS sugar transporter subunit IIA [candidate division KSB1 bacterium]